jgi:DnaK suppressor protein
MDDLTDDQLRELKALLEEQKLQHEELLDRTREGARPVALDEPIGRLTRMDAMQQQSMTAANRRAHEERLSMVHRALAAMKKGEYGECHRCEELIAYARLKARPETILCLNCQSSLDGKRG